MIIVILIYHRRRFHTYIGLYNLMSHTFHEYQRMRFHIQNQCLRNKYLDLVSTFHACRSKSHHADINRSVQYISQCGYIISCTLHYIHHHITTSGSHVSSYIWERYNYDHSYINMSSTTFSYLYWIIS